MLACFWRRYPISYTFTHNGNSRNLESFIVNHLQDILNQKLEIEKTHNCLCLSFLYSTYCKNQTVPICPVHFVDTSPEPFHNFWLRCSRKPFRWSIVGIYPCTWVVWVLFCMTTSNLLFQWLRNRARFQLVRRKMNVKQIGPKMKEYKKIKYI